MSGSEETVQESSKWLNAFSDPLAGLYTFSSCMTLADLYGDGDNKLILADLGTGKYNMTLKVYKGVTLFKENALVDLPTAVVTFFMDNAEPRIPAIAVASGPSVYVYKNLKPYYKFPLPNMDISETEREVWAHVKNDQLDIKSLGEVLESLRSQMTLSAMTPRSQRFLMITEEEEQENFVNSYKNDTLKKQSIVTCLTTIKKSSQDRDAIDSLVVGAENGDIFILDSEAFTILAKSTVPGAPSALHASVSLENKEVHIYQDMFLVDLIRLDDVATGLRFGRFGREEGAMVLSTRNGGINVKLFKRTARLEEKSSAPGPPAAQGQKLNIPKKTKVFVDQTIREREDAKRMHEVFQRDLFMLRLQTTRSYAKMLETNHNPIALNPDQMLKLSAQVQGFGPIFQMNVFLQTTSVQAVVKLFITFQYNPRLYLVEKNIIPVPMLVPGIQYSFETKVTCLMPDRGLSDDITVLVGREEKSSPLLTAVITMPVSEQSLVD